MFIAAVALSRGGLTAVPVGGLVFLINLKERFWGDNEN